MTPIVRSGDSSALGHRIRGLMELLRRSPDEVLRFLLDVRMVGLSARDTVDADNPTRLGYVSNCSMGLTVAIVPQFRFALLYK